MFKKESTFILYFLAANFCMAFISCQEKGNSVPKKGQNEKNALVFSQKLEVPKGEMVHLLPEAEKETSTWLAYVAARAEVEQFEKYTVEEVAYNASTTLEIMKSLQETIPKIFRVKPVRARISVLVTLASVLEQTAGYPDSSAEKIKNTAEKIPMAFRTLKIQLNEVFRKGLKDFKLELKSPDTMEKPKLKKALFNPKTKKS